MEKDVPLGITREARLKRTRFFAERFRQSASEVASDQNLQGIDPIIRQAMEESQRIMSQELTEEANKLEETS